MTRLYRGLKEPYQPEKVGRGSGRMFGTDFTDCPWTALRYAEGRRGVVLVLDVPEGGARVTEELWPGTGARRLVVWGRFDQFVAGVIPAKELRAHVNRRGIVRSSDSYKAGVLEVAISSWLETSG